VRRTSSISVERNAGAPHLVRRDRSDGGDRIALQNAASIASLMLTTEAMVAEIPKKKLVRPGGYRPEGMDY